SIVDMTSASEVLEFADSTSLHWVNGTTASGATLHIAHWTGNAVNGGGADQILFPSVDSLTPNQLNQIIFDDSGFTHAKLIAVGSGAELVPTSTAPTGVLTLGDINQDGHVNGADILALMRALTDINKYETIDHSLTPIQAMTIADINFDDKITNADLQAL